MIPIGLKQKLKDHAAKLGRSFAFIASFGVDFEGHFKGY
jgi:hypothetical protein